MNYRRTKPKEVFYAFRPEGIRAKGWIEKQIQEDAENGWVPTSHLFTSYPELYNYSIFDVKLVSLHSKPLPAKTLPMKGFLSTAEK